MLARITSSSPPHSLCPDHPPTQCCSSCYISRAHCTLHTSHYCSAHCSGHIVFTYTAHCTLHTAHCTHMTHQIRDHPPTQCWCCYISGAQFRLRALHNLTLHTQLLYISCTAYVYVYFTCISHIVHSEHCNLHILDDIPFAGLFAKHILPYNAQEHLKDCTLSTKKHTLNKLLRKEGWGMRMIHNPYIPGVLLKLTL